MHFNRSRIQWQDAVAANSKALTRSFFLRQIVAKGARKKALAREQSSWTSFLGTISLNRIKGTQPLRTKKRKAMRRNSSSSSSDISEEHLANSDDVFLASLKGAAVEPLSNFSTKSAYEREGAIGLDEIPEHRLESIPEDLLNEV